MTVENKHKFFLDVAKECGWKDPGLVKELYYGLLRKILKDLSTIGYVKLPGFGMFKVIVWKGRVMKNVAGGDRVVGDKNTVNFVRSEDLINYVHERGVVHLDGKK